MGNALTGIALHPQPAVELITGDNTLLPVTEAR